jgi:dihydrolipoamide dehydrogenase
MPETYDVDLTVIGGGPAGYVGAIRACQLGLGTRLVEKQHLGGICLNWGCIPSKALIHKASLFRDIAGLEAAGLAVDRSGFDYGRVQAGSRKAAERLAKGVAFLLKKNRVDVVMGEAELLGPQRVRAGEKEWSTRCILLATGSRPAELGPFPFDEKDVLSSTGALQLTSLPRRMLILGAGAVGVEFAYVFNAFGVEVHVVEMLDQVLPGTDAEVAAVTARAFKKAGIKTYLSARALSFERRKDGLGVALEGGGKVPSELTVDTILAAVGRRPNSEGLGLEAAGVEIDRGFVQVGDYYRTKVESIYAAGDVIPTAPLAHVASREAEIAVEHMAGHQTEARVDERDIPFAVYCEPQVAGFGLTEKWAADEGIPFETSVFPFRGAGKAVAVEKVDGLVKIIFAPETREILGAHIAGSDASELIHELLLARRAGLRPADLARTIHAHPTLSEAVREAALGVDGRPIHV